MATIGTFNEEGTNVDLYIPRKCHATNTLITSYDHSAVQIAIANVDANGVIDGTTTTFCIAGYLRAQGESDHAINHLAIDRGIIRIKTARPKKKRTTAAATAAAAKNKKKGLKMKAGATANASRKGQVGRKGTAANTKGGSNRKSGATTATGGSQSNKNSRRQGAKGARPQNAAAGGATKESNQRRGASGQKSQAPRRARA
uniref:40S ribosomal protein S21 n=1 Tax=Lygus hesperus TaxID=30085 RepID=A0A0A9YWD4_LYGHE